MPLKVYYLTFKGQFYIPNSLPKQRKEIFTHLEKYFIFVQ